MTRATATSLKLKETCLQKMKHWSSVLKDRRMPSSAPIWTPRCGRRCVCPWAALSGNRYRWHFNSLQMKRPWENRPEFVPSVVVYSIAFLVSKKIQLVTVQIKLLISCMQSKIKYLWKGEWSYRNNVSWNVKGGRHQVSNRSVSKNFRIHHFLYLESAP